MSYERFISKDELLCRLRVFSENERSGTPIERARAKQLAAYLERTTPDGNILDSLAAHIAFGVEEDMQLSQREQRLLLFTDGRPVSLTELARSVEEEFRRSDAIRYFATLLERATGMKSFREYLRSYWDAQYNVLWQLADRFKKKVWQTGLCELVRESSRRRLRGKLSKTRLSTEDFTGGVSVIFSRSRGRDRNKIAYFVGVDGNHHHLCPGPASEAPLSLTIDMVSEVISRWPVDTVKQMKLMKPVK